MSNPAVRSTAGMHGAGLVRTMNPWRWWRSSAEVSAMPSRFHDRLHAGRVLARELVSYRGRADVIVLALPRGGIPVGYEVARELEVPLDVFVVRKLGVPTHEELAMGAIASGGVRLLDHEIIRMYGVSREDVEMVTRWEQEELERRERSYR